jgi:hypothetical protein
MSRIRTFLQIGPLKLARVLIAKLIVEGPGLICAFTTPP